MKKIIAAFLFIFYISTAYGQSKIEGLVRDCSTAEPLPYVAIYAQSTGIGTNTDIDGKFSLDVDVAFPLTLTLKYVGYAEQKVVVDSSGYFEICMKEYENLLSNCPSLPSPLIEASPIHVYMPMPFMKILPRQLQRDNDESISPALNRVTGLYMHSGALNTNRITIRGVGNRSPFSTTKIRAYLDEIPLTSGDGETTIEDIDLSLIEKIQVWKGPTASIYGAGLGGMIHLQTNPDYLRTYFSNKTSIGSYRLLRNTSDVNFTNKNRNVNIRLNYNRTHSDGYRDNNEYDRQGFTLLGKVKENEENETTFLANYIDLKAFIPSSLNRTDFDSNPQKAAFTWANVRGFEDGQKTMLGISHKTKLADLEDSRLTNKTSLFTRFRNAYESRPFNILEEENRVLGLRTIFELNRERHYGLFPMFSVGLEMFNEKYNWQTFETNDGVQGASLSDNEETRKYYNAFAQFYKSITDELSVLAGVNFNNTNYEYKDLFTADSVDLSGNYTFDPTLSPQLGLSYLINYDMSLFATVSHGFSPPALSETLTPDGMINPEIQPEQGWNFEIGSRGQLQSKLKYEVTLYNMIVRDLLVAQRVGPDQFVGVNAGKTRHSGLELYGEYAFYIRNSTFNLFTSYTYSNYKFLDFKDGDEDHSGNDLTGTAPHNFNLGLDMQWPFGLSASINYKYIDAFPMRDDNAVYSDAYQVLDMKVTYSKSLFTNLDAAFYAGVRNLANEKYASMILINAGSFGGNAPRYYYPGLPRNYYAGLSLKYWL